MSIKEQVMDYLETSLEDDDTKVWLENGEEKYYILAWDTYYPAGGMGNMKEIKGNISDAIGTAKKYSIEYDEGENEDYLQYDCAAVWDVANDEITWWA